MKHPLFGAPTRPGVYLSSALADPLRDFFSRYRSAGGLILALICLYRVPDFVLNIMNPFYLDLGYTLVEIAEIRKIFGVVMTMFGVFAGGVAVARYGLMRAMVIGALAGPLSNLLFVWLALQEHNLFALFAAIGLDNVYRVTELPDGNTIGLRGWWEDEDTFVVRQIQTSPDLEEVLMQMDFTGAGIKIRAQETVLGNFDIEMSGVAK